MFKYLTKWYLGFASIGRTIDKSVNAFGLVQDHWLTILDFTTTSDQIFALEQHLVQVQLFFQDSAMTISNVTFASWTGWFSLFAILTDGMTTGTLKPSRFSSFDISLTNITFDEFIYNLTKILSCWRWRHRQWWNSTDYSFVRSSFSSSSSSSISRLCLLLRYAVLQHMQSHQIFVTISL